MGMPVIDEAAKFVKHLQDNEEMYKNNLEVWKQRLNDDPSYAFAWGDNGIKAAAFMEVYGHASSFVSSITEQQNWKNQAKSYFIDKLTTSLRSGVSTNRCCNLYDAFVSEAWASVVSNSYLF